MSDSNKMKKLLELSTTMPMGAGQEKPSFMTGGHLSSHVHGAGCGCNHADDDEDED